jgi:hypothetical protein
MRTSFLVERALLLGAAFICMVRPAAGQILSPEPLGTGGFAIELTRPSLRAGSDLDVLTLAGALGVRVPLGNGTLLAELPFARVGYHDFANETAIGNLLLGYEAGSGATRFIATVRAPTASENEAALFGALSDVLQVEAFLPEVTSLRAGVLHRGSRTGRAAVDVHLSGVLFIPKEGDTDGALDYGVQGVIRPKTIGITAGIAGRAIVTGDNMSFAERTMHQLFARIDYTAGNVRPYVGVTVPMDDDVRDVVNATWRAGLQVKTK